MASGLTGCCPDSDSQWRTRDQANRISKGITLSIKWPRDWIDPAVRIYQSMAQMWLEMLLGMTAVPLDDLSVAMTDVPWDDCCAMV